MNAAEEQACAKLRITHNGSVIETLGATKSGVERLNLRKRRRFNDTHKYVNCDFILISAAKVERLWSICKHILRDNRKSMTLLFFKTLLFMKASNSYCGQDIVIKAMKMVQSGNLNARIREDAEQASLPQAEVSNE